MTGSISDTGTVSPAQTSTPTPSRTRTRTSTGTPSVTGSDTSTPSSTSSLTNGASPSYTPSSTIPPSPSRTPSRTGTATLTRTPTPSPTLTPTPSTSPPPFVCASRGQDGCAAPTLTLLPSLLSGGSSLTPAAGQSASLTSYSFLTLPAVLSLPVLPSGGESLSINCSTTSPANLVLQAVSVAATLVNRSCAVGTLCLQLPLSFSPPLQEPLQLFFNLTQSAPVPLPTPSTLTCTITSTPRITSNYLAEQLPRYPVFSVLPSLPLLSLPATAPLLSAILAETSSALLLRVLAGFGGPTVPVPSQCPFSLRWPPLQPCAGAFELLASTLPALQSPPSPSLSSNSTLLLFTVPATPFPPTLTVSLNGLPCTLHWVSPSRTVAAITPPALSSLCSPASSDCGSATLLLTAGPGPTATSADPLLLSLDLTSTSLPLPATFPPLPLPTLLGAPSLPTLLSRAAALTQSSRLLITYQCVSEPSYAPPSLCAVLDGSQPSLNATPTLRCPWGRGDSCQPCPAGALCPGGEKLRTLPGYWAPSEDSAPTSLQACLPPSPTTRCPGTASSSASLCGPGYTGQLCAGCAPAYFVRDGLCEACPDLSAAVALAVTLAKFLLGLLLLGLLLQLLLYSSLKLRAQRLLVRAGSVPPPPVTLRSTLRPVGQFLVWVWISAQSCASLFTQAQSIAPSSLTDLYSSLSALQFQGLSVNPKCITGVSFPSFWGIGLLLLVCTAVLLGGLLAQHFAPPGRVCSQHASAVTSFALLALLLVYGAVTGILADTLTCTTPAPLSLLDYVTAVSDGSAYAAAFGAQAAGDFEELRVAAQFPAIYPTQFLKLTQLQVPVSLLASDRFQVCLEGPHLLVWRLSIVAGLLYSLGLPLFILGAIWGVGKCKCLRRRLPGGLVRRATAAAASTSPTPPPPHPLLSLAYAATRDDSVRGSFAALPVVDMLTLLLISGLVGLSKRMSTPSEIWAVQSGIMLTALASFLLLALGSPYKRAHAWKGSVSMGLQGLTALTALMNGLGFAPKGQPPALSQPTRLALALLPLVYGLFLLLLLLVSWWLNSYRVGTGALPLMEPDKAPPPPPAPVWARVRLPGYSLPQWRAVTWQGVELQAGSDAELPTGALIEGGWVRRCTEEGQQQQQAWWWHAESSRAEWVGPWEEREAAAATHWAAVYREEDKQWLWHCEASGELREGLPEGALTACGWEQRGGVWVKPSTGESSPTPPVAQGRHVDEEHAASVDHRWVRCEGAEGGYWHQPLTGTSLQALPPDASTDCGWELDAFTGLWVHAESGAQRLAPPPHTPSEALEAEICQARARAAWYKAGLSPGTAWVRSADSAGWRQPSSGAVCTALPAFARTGCGWWQQRAGLRMWVHAGTGATSKEPPSLDRGRVARLLKAHLQAGEAAAQLK